MRDFGWAVDVIRWLVALSALVCAYFLGRQMGRLAERRDVVKAALNREIAANFRRLVPSQREGER